MSIPLLERIAKRVCVRMYDSPKGTEAKPLREVIVEEFTPLLKAFNELVEETTFASGVLENKMSTGRHLTVNDRQEIREALIRGLRAAHNCPTEN